MVVVVRRGRKGGGGWVAERGAEFVPQSHTLPDPLVSVILSPQGFHQRPGWQASWFSGFQMLNTIYKEKKRKRKTFSHTCSHILCGEVIDEEDRVRRERVGGVGVGGLKR